MDTPSISTEIVTICGGLALLAPLVNAFSKWHVTVRKTSKPAVTVTERQSQISAESSQEPWYRRATLDVWLRFSVIVCSLFMSLGGLYLLFILFRRTEPLTTGSAALIAISCTMIAVGYLKDWSR